MKNPNELEQLWKEYMIAHRDLMREYQNTQQKIGDGIEILSKSQADHDNFVRENFGRTLEQHNTLLGKLNDYHKLLIALIAVLAGLVGIKIMQGGI
jgi:ABC-type transporter Mla subunit MlaD